MVCNLSYDEHVTQVASKCIGSLFQINRVKHLFDKHMLVTIISSLVISRLLYIVHQYALIPPRKN